MFHRPFRIIAVTLLQFIIALIPLSSQVVDFLRDQPHQLAYNSIRDCCFSDTISRSGYSQYLISCLKVAIFDIFNASKKHPVPPKVKIISFFTDDIIDYAAYALAINSAYSEQHNYDLRVFQSEDIPWIKEEIDSRWIKIRLLIEMIESSSNVTGFSQQSPEFVVWMDSDLAILDFGMRIEEIASQNLKAHIIMSKDIPKANFVSNSGFIIARVSSISLNILKQWWNNYDRSKCCDQNAFTWLYDRFTPEQKSHIALLRPDAINTHFPCWKHQKPYNQVLHLAGMTSLYRIPVFQYGWAQVCQAVVSLAPTVLSTQQSFTYLSHLPLQLGLTRERLLSFAYNLNAERLVALAALKDALSEHIKSGSLTLDEFFGLKAKANDYLKFDDDEPSMMSSSDLMLLQWEKRITPISSVEVKAMEVRRLLHDVILTKARRMLSLSTKPSKEYYDEHLSSDSQSRYLEMVESMNQVIVTGFDLMALLLKQSNQHQRSSKCSIDQRVILEGFQDILFEELPQYSSAQFISRRLLYYQFKFSQMMAATFAEGLPGRSTASDTQVIGRILWLEKAVEYWVKMASSNFFGTDYVMADPYKEGSDAYLELAVLQCYSRNFTAGLAAFAQSLLYQELTLRGYDAIKIATTDITDRAAFHFAESLVNAGICARESGNDALARSHFQRAHDFYTQWGCGSADTWFGDPTRPDHVVPNLLCDEYRHTIDLCTRYMETLSSFWSPKESTVSDISTSLSLSVSSSDLSKAVPSAINTPLKTKPLRKIIYKKRRVKTL